MLPDVRSFDDPKIRKLVRMERIKADTLDLFGEDPPAALMEPYPLDEAGQARLGLVQKKYRVRSRNIKRSWNRVQLYLPEMLPPCAPQSVLEMSTGHGGMLEVLRHFGHSVTGNDFANMVAARNGQDMAQFRKVNDADFVRQDDDRGLPLDGSDWPYRPIVQSINLPVKIFDAGHLPYPVDDKSVDVVLCFQAIEHYCHPDHWMDIVAEFCRISRKTVFVMLNRLVPEFRDVAGYEASFDSFRRHMRSYRAHGFHCTGCFVHWNQALGFKLTAI